MSDIVERLRKLSMALCGGSLRQPEAAKLADEAADEIERLRAIARRALEAKQSHRDNPQQP